MPPKRPKKIVEPPKGGLWRVGRSPDPLRFGDPLDPGLLENGTTGNRFDSPTGDYRVCYFATTVEACFGETLSRFRPDPGLSAAANEEGFMALGEVPADWRHRRLAVRAVPASSKAIPVVRFLDVEAAETRALLRNELGELLAYYGYSDLDVPTVRGGDRRITRWIGRWSYEQRDAGRSPQVRRHLLPVAALIRMGVLGAVRGRSAPKSRSDDPSHAMTLR